MAISHLALSLGTLATREAKTSNPASQEVSKKMAKSLGLRHHFDLRFGVPASALMELGDASGG